MSFQLCNYMSVHLILPNLIVEKKRLITRHKIKKIAWEATGNAIERIEQRRPAWNSQRASLRRAPFGLFVGYFCLFTRIRETRMYFCHRRVFYPPPPSAISSISLPVTKQRPKCPADAFVSDTFLPTIQNHRLAATHLSNLARPIDEFIAEQEWSNIIYDCETKWKRVGGEIKWDLKNELWIFYRFLSTKRECLTFYTRFVKLAIVLMFVIIEN